MVSATAYPNATAENRVTSTDSLIEFSYAATRDQLRDFLIRATLIESYHSFTQHDKPYPFTTLESLWPGISTAAYEHPYQRSALILLVDGPLPASMRKHIRFRSANEMTATNLLRLAPEIYQDVGLPQRLSMGNAGFSTLLNRLLDVDYALLMQRTDAQAPIGLSHLHVKVERLTDNAVRVLARDLGYIRRTLYERGEAHAEILERKFYEYFGFAANASGRKCAAAMAAQLLAAEAPRFAVFASCQEDCRLTVIDESETVTHHVLIRLEAGALRRIGGEEIADYAINDDKACDGHVVVCLRAQFQRSAAAQPLNSSATVRPDTGLAEPWLKITRADILPQPGLKAPVLPYNESS
jgi:hypothetical protein